MEKMRMESVDLTAQNIDKIAVLFPNCITETTAEDGTVKKAVDFKIHACIHRMKLPFVDDALPAEHVRQFYFICAFYRLNLPNPLYARKFPHI